MPGKPQMTMETKMPAMNISPPIVGVPAFPECHVGPSSRILCPALSARSLGISTLPVAAATAKLKMQAITIFMFFDHSPIYSASFLCSFAKQARTTSRSSSGYFVVPMI